MPNISDGLVRRILADPGDALTRLVFADWLEESGDPDHEAWAVYIRLRARANDDPNAIDRDLATERAAETGLRVAAQLTVPVQEFAQDISARIDLLPAANYSVTVRDYNVPRPALGRVTQATAGMWRGLPLATARGRTLLGMVAPSDTQALQSLTQLIEGDVVAVRVPGDQLAHLVERTFTRAIALVGMPPAEVTMMPAPPTATRGNSPARAYSPSGYLDRLISEARVRGAAAIELTAHAEEYQVSLVAGVRPTRWQSLDAELGRELAELARESPPARTRVTPRASRHGWGVRIEWE